MVWFPKALRDGGFPHEGWFFCALALAGGLACWAWARRHPRGRAELIAAAWGLILMQTCLHTSLRSPYSYTQWAEDGATWSSKALFSDGSGVVNGDVAHFLGLNDLFNGYPTPITTWLLRRPYAHFLAAPFTFFCNPFLVFLVLNAAWWMAAVACGYDYALRLTGNTRTARLFAALVLMGNGFIYFAAQPMSYLAGYASVMVILCLHERLLVETRAPWLFGAALALCSLVYDLFPLYVGLVALGVYRRVPLGANLRALGLAGALYGGYLYIAYDLLGLPDPGYNSRLMLSALPNIAEMARHGSFDVWYRTGVGLVRTLAQNLLFAFLGAETLAALLLILLARRSRIPRVAAVLLVPTLVLNAVLYVGQVHWNADLLIELPRLSYIAYPAVYLVLADGLARLRPRVIAGLMVLVFAWHNVDVLGLPEAYFHFYFPDPIYFQRH
jgi:hypothetical protein